jgi:hypothetical protein
VRKKVFRMSGPVVAIGFILLIPSVLGMLFSAMILLQTIEHSGNTQDPGELFGSVFGVGFAITFGVASFVGGLFGWLLVMKKQVLQCSDCGAVVSAS